MSVYQNNWNAIRAFYADMNPLILTTPKDQWAFGAYCWEESQGMINFTPIENWLWADIRECGAVLWPQYPILNFFVDFANPVAKVAIECDGAAYHLDKAKDEARDKRLQDAGWTVYRITGKHCRIGCDEDTGAPGLPLLFMKQICNLHGISSYAQPDLDVPPEKFKQIDYDVDQGWELVIKTQVDALWRKGQLTQCAARAAVSRRCFPITQRKNAS